MNGSEMNLLENKCLEKCLKCMISNHKSLKSTVSYFMDPVVSTLNIFDITETD